MFLCWQICMHACSYILDQFFWTELLLYALLCIVLWLYKNFNFFLFSAYVLAGMRVTVYMRQLEDNSWELILFYSLVNYGDLRQVIRLPNKHFSPLSHLTRPKSFVLNKTLCFVLNGSTHLPHLQNLDTHRQEDDLSHLWSHNDWWSHRHPGSTQVTSLSWCEVSKESSLGT